MHTTCHTIQARTQRAVLWLITILALSPTVGCGGCATSPPEPPRSTRPTHPNDPHPTSEPPLEPCGEGPCGPTSLPSDKPYPDRYLHAATPLVGDKLLITGGYTLDAQRRGALASTLLLNLRSDRSEPTAALTYKRWGHTATLLPDGSVLVVGGSMDDPERSPFRQAPPELWSQTPQGPSWRERLPPWKGRLRHTATLLPDGSVLVLGGAASYEESLRLPERYDPVNNTWTRLTEDHVPRYDHTATLLQDGSVLVLGGRHGTGCGEDCAIDCLEDMDCGQGAVCADEFYCTRPLRSAALYAPDTDTWTRLPELPEPSYDHTATLLTDGSVLVTGGRNGAGALKGAYLFDLGLRSWTRVAPMTSARAGHTATKRPDGQVWVVGGRAPIQGEACDDGNPCPSDRLFNVLAHVEVYDPTTRAWRSTTPLNRARYDHTATLLSTGELITWGGATHNRAAVLGGERSSQPERWTVIPHLTPTRAKP